MILTWSISGAASVEYAGAIVGAMLRVLQVTPIEEVITIASPADMV